MATVDFEYYQTAYGGTLFEDDGTFNRYAKKSERKINRFTYNRIMDYPMDTGEDHWWSLVFDCICETAELLKKVDDYSETADNFGMVANDDGTIRGKIIKSESSGSESRTYDTGSGSSTLVELAKSEMELDKKIYGICLDYFSGIEDAKGTCLLYAGCD